MKNIWIRKCEYKDCEFLYKLANDKLCRENSFNSDFIEYNIHKIWFNKSLKSNDRKIFIVQYMNKDIGQIRMDFIHKNCAEISYSLDKEYRGKGIGTYIVALIKDIIKDKYKNIKVIQGKVKFSNISSRKVFLKNGYLEIKEESFYKYIYKL